MDEAAYERRFRRAGLPLLIEGYSPQEDVFTRAWPLLAVVALGEVLGAVDLDWSTWANVATLAGGLAILVGALVLRNRLRGRPALARPERLDPPELAGFVIVPALLPVIFNGQVTSALVTAGANLALLAVVWLVVGFGLLSIVRWAAVRLLGQLAASLTLLARALPLLMLFSVVLFLTTEVWQVFAEMGDASLAAVAGLLVVTGAVFVAARLPREVTVLEAGVAAGPALRRAQRVNVGLVLFVSHALQALVVSAAIGAFFVALGLLVINPDVLEAWLGHGGHALLDTDILGIHVRLTSELLRVAIGLAALSGLYYAIAVLVDPTYREEFLTDVTADMRATFADRAAYLALHDRPPRGEAAG